jgi:predicted DNA binding CopG/RHH family protein
MSELDAYEADILSAYERGEIKPLPKKQAHLGQFRAAASATFLKDKRVNIRLTTPDLMDIQVRALQEGIPYQTLIASVLHKYVAGHLTEQPLKKSRSTPQSLGV